MSAVGQCLKIMRERFGLSIEQVAQAASVGSTFLARVEAGTVEQRLQPSPQWYGVVAQAIVREGLT